MDIHSIIQPLSWPQIGAALLCGGIIGLERQIRGRPAGIRTSIMICFGTSLFVQLGQTINGASSDHTRVLGQIITGIGFLGAGVMLARGGLVMGVTSASVIWILAAVGSAIGLGYISAAIVVSIIAVCVLVLVDILEASVKGLRGGVHAPILDAKKRPKE